MSPAMKKEAPYEFRTRMREYYFRPCRVPEAVPRPNEVEITAKWSVKAADPAEPLLARALADLSRFFKTALACPLSGTGEGPEILISAGNAVRERPSCRFDVSEKGITIEGNNPRGALYGVIRLEDLMRLRGGSFLPAGSFTYTPLARMRSTHSGSGLDDFPDWQLECILHAGFTAIDLFVKGIDETTQGHYDIGDLIDRAAGYGLDVVLYNYQTCYVHPDDADSDAAFDRVFGSLFRAYPRAAALSLCGESLEFPSRDETTIKKSEVEEGSEGLQETKQPTGYFPNSDYPAYLAKLSDAVHRAAPGAEVIFNTYNWGWAPLEARKKFLEAMPESVSLQVTYDIFKSNRSCGLSRPLMDYSIFAAEPGEYFETEVKAAAEAGIKNIRVTSNLAGTTWDFGCVPYAPVPFRWLKRMRILKEYLQKYDVNSFYDSHHFGWFPNVCGDLAKAVFSERAPEDLERFLHDVAARDYGEAADAVVKAWKIWSDAMDHYVGSNEDQYGPWRVGPAYPFVFHPTISRTMDEKYVRFPFTDRAYNCNCMVKTMYAPFENDAQSPGPLRQPVELRELEVMLEMWEQGTALLEKAHAAVPEADPRREELARLLGLGLFIRNMIRTTSGIKRWRAANLQLQCCSDREGMEKKLDEISGLLEAERRNVLETIPLAEADSRLGWEPRMDYVCDAPHLKWKLRQLAIAEEEIKAYRKMIRL